MSAGSRDVPGAIRLAVAGGLLACVLFGWVFAVPTMAQSANDSIEGVELSGDAVVSTEGNTTYLWQDEPLNLTVQVTNRNANATRNYQVCPFQVGESEQRLAGRGDDGCPGPTLDPETTRSVSFSGIEWPADATGQQQLRVDLELASTGEDDGTLLGQQTVSVTVITRDGDIDDDGLANSEDVVVGLDDPDVDDDGLEDGEEIAAETDPNDADSDDDGLEDGEEVNRYGTDPNDADSDGDGIDDGFEVQTLGTNPTSQWTPVLMALVGLVVIGLVLTGVVVVRRRRNREDAIATGSANATRSDEHANSAPEEAVGEETAHRDRTAHDESPGVDTGRRGETDRPPSTGSDDLGPEVGPERQPALGPLTDEDRVLSLLQERGGRMKQATIVEETAWSKAKVSRLLSSMDEAGQIEKLSIGRENVISLPGHGPEAAHSAHEE